MHARHLRQGGSRTLDEFAAAKAFLMDRPCGRPAQPFAAYTQAPSDRPAMRRAARQPYVSLLGLRADEPRRVARVRLRAMGKEEPCGGPPRASTSERPRCPLSEWGMHKVHILEFWSRPENRQIDLNLPTHGSLSNCVFCFMKRPTDLARALTFSPESQKPDTPQSIEWWAKMESKYRRELNSSRRGNGITMGFFGIDFADEPTSPRTYTDIAERGVAALGMGTSLELLPCDCTD